MKLWREEKLVDKLSGTSGMNDGSVAEEFGISLDELEDIMADHGYERCPDCEWWCETGELTDEDSNPTSCESCRPRKRESEE